VNWVRRRTCQKKFSGCVLTPGGCAGAAARMLCLKTAQSRRRGEPSVRAKRTQASTFVHEESTRFAAANTGQGRRSRRLRLGSQRRGAPGWPFGRRKARSRNKLAGAPNTPAKRVRISANLVIDRGAAAVSRVLERESRSSASISAMSRQAKRAASRRTAAQRSAGARKAVRTKSAAGRSAASRGAVQTRARRKA